METKIRLGLKHIDTEMFISWSPSSMPLTEKISQARRFLNIEDVSHFLNESPYRPDNPESYEIVEIQIDYSIKESVPSE